MNVPALIDRLRAAPPAFAGLLDMLTLEDARRKGPSGQWSICEIIHHLADEEDLDFFPRLVSTLNDPTTPWKPTDPEGWARDARYNDSDPHAALERFTTSRARTIKFLAGLTAPDWSLTHHHPKGFNVSAGDLLVAWAAHDALHIRQIAKRLFEFAARDGEPEGFKTTYAGEWGA